MTKNECNEHTHAHMYEGREYGTQTVYFLSHTLVTNWEANQHQYQSIIIPQTEGTGERMLPFCLVVKMRSNKFYPNELLLLSHEFCHTLRVRLSSDGRPCVHLLHHEQQQQQQQPRLRTESHLSRARTRACTVHEYDK